MVTQMVAYEDANSNLMYVVKNGKRTETLVHTGDGCAKATPQQLSKLNAQSTASYRGVFDGSIEDLKVAANAGTSTGLDGSNEEMLRGAGVRNVQRSTFSTGMACLGAAGAALTVAQVGALVDNAFADGHFDASEGFHIFREALEGPIGNSLDVGRAVISAGDSSSGIMDFMKEFVSYLFS